MTLARLLVAGVPGGGRWLLAVGLLHVLEADLLTGGAGGSRVVEAHKPRSRTRVPTGGVGLVCRALDAAVEPVTLPAWREGARPPHRTAA